MVSRMPFTFIGNFQGNFIRFRTFKNVPFDLWRALLFNIPGTLYMLCGMYEFTTNSQEKVTGNERKYLRHKCMTGFIDLHHGGKIAKISAKVNRTTFPTLILYPNNKESLTFAFSVRLTLVYYYFFFLIMIIR